MEMMKIERWKIEVAPNEPDNCGLVTDPHGEWVLFDDHMSQVNTIMREAVWAMEQFVMTWDALALVTIQDEAERNFQRIGNPHYQRAQAFLASQAVAEWRKREEKR